MKTRLFYCLVFVLCLLVGCTLLEAESLQQPDNIPKSYSLAIGYLNEAQWQRASEQLLRTVDESDVQSFQEAALLLLIHVTNGELEAYKETTDTTVYSELLENRTAYYEQLLTVQTAMENDSFMGLNYNLKVPLFQDESVSDIEKQQFTLVSNYIVTHWAELFNESPVDLKLLLEQAASTVEQGNESLAEQLRTKAEKMGEGS